MTGVHIEWVGEEAVVLDVETKQLHHLNPSAALVYALLHDFDHAGVVAELRKRFPDETDLEEQVIQLVADLKDKGLLVDE